MKILFVDNSADLQQKYIEPLRKRGWGVVRARSIEDANRMMLLHGDGLDAIVVNEKYVVFGEQNEPPFVVLTSQWGAEEIAQHQSSKNPAVGYFAAEEGSEKIYSLFHAQSSVHALKATGTEGVPLEGLPLENYSGVLSRPEPTSTYTRSLSLQAPLVLLGGVDVSPKAEVAPMEEISLDFSESESQNDNKTVVLDKTQIADALGLQDPAEELPDFKFDSELDLSISDAVVPAAPAVEMRMPPVSHASLAGGTDIETLKSYLALREQDVAVLSGQFRSSEERVRQLELQVKVEKARAAELQQMLLKSEQKIKTYDQDKRIELELVEKQMDDLSLQLKERTEKARAIEAKLRLTAEEVSRVKDRVRVDIRRIRVREKELESQLEILKKDSSALLHARDEKIMELKRKVDLLEFNMELVQEQFQKERQASDDLKMRLRDAAQAMKQANGLLEQ